MNRLEKFSSFYKHPRHSKLLGKLSLVDRRFCVSWITENDSLDQNDFEFKVNRMFMDKADKPKNWTVIAELLASANVGEVK